MIAEKLSIGELVTMANSSALGPVATRVQVQRLVDAAGGKIRGRDGTSINLLRFIAHLHQQTHSASDYELHRQKMGKIAAEKSAAGRDIAPIPAIVNPGRREACSKSLELFERTYLPLIFNLPWAPYHHRLCALTEAAIRGSEQSAVAVPRGGGKSVHHMAGALFALLYGYCKFVVIIGADAPNAEKRLEAMAEQLESNDLFFEDFPEVCYPVRRLEGMANRANGQTVGGIRTKMVWTNNEIVLPFIAGSASASGCVRAFGITGSIKGAKFQRPDGQWVRPDLALIDDAETDESAESPSQVAKREALVDGSILGLAGPGKRIAVLMSCTVSARNCMADRRVNRRIYPEWHGERHGILTAIPSAGELWAEYRRLRDEAMRRDAPTTEATAYYLAYQAPLEAGATATWPDRKSPEEASAIQHAMNILFRIGRARFMAEYMNAPEVEESSDNKMLEPDMVAAKANGMERGLVPIWATRLVAFCDVNKEILYYGVVAVDDVFRGHVVDYGPWPQQPHEYWIKRDVKATLEGVEGVIGLEASLRAGLDSLAARLLSKPWPRQDQGVQTIERMLVDARWPDSQEVVHAFCRESVHSAVLTPSYGQYVGAKHLPMTERNKAVGDRVGLNWKMPKPKPGRQRYVTFDTNFWKQFLERRWLQPLESPGCWTIFGSPEDHRLFADHNTAEYIVQTTARGRTVDEYQAKPARDNEGFDAMVGCCVAASIGGSALAEMPRFAHKPKETIKLSDRVVAGRAAYESASVPQTDAAMTVAENPALRQGLNRQAAAEFDEPISAQPAAAPSKSGPARIKLSDLIRKGRLQ